MIPISGATGIMEIKKLVEKNEFTDAAAPGKLSQFDIAPEYGKFLRSFITFDRKLKVVVDFANAMGTVEIAGIRDKFEIIPLYENLDGTFPNHEANPLKSETLDAMMNPGASSRQFTMVCCSKEVFSSESIAFIADAMLSRSSAI